MRKTLLAGACDCHVHVVGPTGRFPQSAHGSYLAAPAALEELRAVAEPLGVSRFVIVQPSFYGTDNSCLFEALDKLGDSGRGVAVVDATSISSSMLESYDQRGICGLRLNFYSSPVADVNRKLERSLADTLDVLPRDTWHVEIIARAGTLAAAAPIIARSKIPIVIDHYGLPEDEAPESPAGRALLELISLPHVWIKLSAPYRCSKDPLATSPPSEWLAALVHTAPDRCVWGSDWPHTPPRNDARSENKMLPYRKISYERLFDDFYGALESPELARRVLIENPTRLYGFPDARHARSE
ncbi:MAG: amidohydrolase 2 [Candidatus Acidoferrum typicum]|nr:amidohydrolase 2 [Candidatus Acidoferrum typicum]